MEITWPKLLLANVVLLLVLAAVVSSSGEATEDLGEPDPLVSACHFTQSLVEATVGTPASSCRRGEGELVYRHGGRSVIVPVSVRVNGAWINLDVFMEKSLWYGSALRAR